MMVIDVMDFAAWYLDVIVVMDFDVILILGTVFDIMICGTVFDVMILRAMLDTALRHL